LNLSFNPQPGFQSRFFFCSEHLAALSFASLLENKIMHKDKTQQCIEEGRGALGGSDQDYASG
jgi:hypothetical protein